MGNVALWACVIPMSLRAIPLYRVMGTYGPSDNPWGDGASLRGINWRVYPPLTKRRWLRGH